MPDDPDCHICFTGLEQIKEGFMTSIDQCRRLKIPRSFKVEDIQKAQKACEMLGDKLRSNPEEMSALLENILQNNNENAKQRAHKLGITEEKFVNQGGGLIWLVVILALLYTTDVY